MTRLHTMSLICLLPLAGCGGGESNSAAPPAPSEPVDVAAEASLKLYVFDCGHLRIDSPVVFGIQDDETDVRELITPCYVNDHPDGRMLWDSGLPSSLAETDGWDGTQRLDRALAGQLADFDLGFDLGSLDYVAFSHMHFDHVGAANEVMGATWLVQQPEYEAMFAATVAGAQTALYENLRTADRVMLNGDHDVFGDGRVRILSAPGHTPGHQALFLDLAETGPLVLSGDLYHFRLSREDHRVPDFNFDEEMTRASMERMESFVAEAGATFWIQHDLALFQQLDTAPSYYE
jgi:N-acyl homoserine lactone hydrolase